jgi:hypothetical protein
MDQDSKDSFELLLRRYLSSEKLSRGLEAQCPDENWMVAYLEGTQSSQTKAEFERHLVKCIRCQGELALLLKSGAMVGDLESPGLSTVSERRWRKTSFSSWFGWLTPLTFRPVFAILTIAVISAFLGYRLVQEQKLTAPSEQVAQSLSKEAAPQEQEKRAEQEQGREFSTARSRSKASDQKQKNRGSANETRAFSDSAQAPISTSSAPEKSARDGERRRKDGFADQYAVEPPVVNQAEKQAEVDEIQSRARQAVPLPTSPAAPQNSAESKPKESASADDGSRQNLRAQSTAPALERPQAQALPQNKAGSAEADLNRGPAGLMKSDADMRTAQDDRAVASSAISRKRKQEQAEAKDSMRTGTYRPSPRLEAGGKFFELRDNIWRDVSIKEEDADQPVTIVVPSSEFERLRKDLIPFEPVLSRSEDVLIKLNNRLYRLRKTGSR